ncbi:MAG: O-antigen ligase family protein, partial [Spirochaetales bacterium]|nr:O-antigen ligase family protein [Spirochaetales bacterium]
LSSADQSRDNSAQSRLDFWATAIDVWKQHPLYGCGLRNFIYYNGVANEGKEWGEPGHVAHSLWFEALAEGGLMVFVPLVTMLLLFFRRTSKAKKKYRGNREIHADLCAFQIGMVGFLVCATFVNRLIYEPMYWWCMIAYSYYSGVASSDEEVLRYVKR